MKRALSEAVVAMPRETATPAIVHRAHRAAFIVFVVAFAVFAVSPVITNYDSYSTFPTAVSLVNRHTLSLDVYRANPTVTGNYTVTRNRGEYVTGYPWTVTLFFVPTVIAIDLIQLAGGPSADHLVASDQMGLPQMETASLVTALACAVMTLLAFERLSGDERRRFTGALACGLLFAFGTSAWSLASRAMWQQAPGFLLLALGLLQLNRLVGRRAGRHAFSTAFFFAAALTVRPTNIVPLGITFIALVIWRRHELTTFVTGAATVLIPWILLTRVAFGTFLQPYYTVDHRSLLQSVMLEALAANLVSPARGILLFSPLCLLALPGAALARHRLDLVARLSLATVPAYWLVVSGLSAGWWGGNTYGPRLMADTFPFIFVLALPVADWVQNRWSDRTTATGPGGTTRRTSAFAMAGIATCALLSVAFNAEGGVLRSTTCWNGRPGTPANVDREPSRVWSWSDPQLLYGFRSLATGSLHRSVLSTCSGSSA